jgi:hypothetical protein
MTLPERNEEPTCKILAGDKYKDTGYGRANPHEQKVKGLGPVLI